MRSYKGSSYYKRNRRIVLISVICLLLLLLAAAIFFFLSECVVYTNDGWRIELPWKDYSQLDKTPGSDDGAEPNFISAPKNDIT